MKTSIFPFRVKTMLQIESARKTLEYFCAFPLDSSEELLKKFAELPGAISHFDGGKKNFVYVPGTRKDRVVLIAHADTVWDRDYGERDDLRQSLKKEDDIYSGVNSAVGIGADDRSGCAILWLLKDSGHSLLVVDGEEHGQIGSHHLREHYPELFGELNDHAYMIQFDRRNGTDYKFYSLPVSRRFERFIQSETGYQDAGRNARTDIIVLCHKICGVNLSVGYYKEHTPDEYLVFSQWFYTLCLAEQLLAPRQKRYLLKGKGFGFLSYPF